MTNVFAAGDQISPRDEEGGGAPDPLHGGGEAAAVARERRRGERGRQICRWVGGETVDLLMNNLSVQERWSWRR